MPKTKISEYSTTNSDNTDIESINIAEGCAPSGINNAIRELMVHLKKFQTGASGDAFTFAGGVLISGTANTITGNVLMSGTNTITGSTTATFAAGAVGTPSIAAHGDTNTGIFFPAADTIAFAEGGAEAMRIDSSGNVGIGTSSPSSYDADFRNMVIAGAASTGISIISGTANNGTLAFGDGTGAANYRGYVQYNHTNDALIFASAASERARIPAAGGFQCVNSISVGNVTPTTSGAGITFPATQSASSDANTLDDYEEGTWEPRIDGTTSAGTGTYSVQVGAYTKVGNLVTITGYLSWSNHTGTGGIQIANFPFASKNTANLYQAVTYGYVNNITLTANTVVASYIAPNSSVTVVRQYPSGGGATTAVAMDTSGEFIFTATYVT